MAATNNSFTIGQKATVPAPQQALSGTFEENVPTWSSSAELHSLPDPVAQVSMDPTPYGLKPVMDCTANSIPAHKTQLVNTHHSPNRVDHSCVTQSMLLGALTTHSALEHSGHCAVLFFWLLLGMVVLR